MPVPPAPAAGTRNPSRKLLIAGAATLGVGLLALAGGLTWANENRTPATVASSTSTSLTLDTTPGATFPGIVGGNETTSTPTFTAPSSETTSSVTTSSEATPTVTTGPATTPTGETAAQNDARLRSMAGGLGFTVFALEDATWQLDQLTSGQTPSAAYVAMVYRKGAQYLSVSQEPRDRAPAVPNAETIQIHGVGAALVDMQSVVLLSWLEQGTAITMSTDVSREEALSLADKLRPLRR